MINAALGFDSYVVQRHGMRSLSAPSAEALLDEAAGGGARADAGTMATFARGALVPAEQLGCYFCTDVVAPTNVRARYIYIKL